MINDTLTNGLTSSLGIQNNNQKPYTYHDDFDHEEYITDYLMEEELEKDPTYYQDFNCYRPDPEVYPPTYHDDFDYEEFFTHSLIDGELLEYDPDSYFNIHFYKEKDSWDIFYETYYSYQSSYDIEYEDELIRQENCEKDFQLEKYFSGRNPNQNSISELKKMYNVNFEGNDDFWNEEMESAESLNEKFLFSEDYFQLMEKTERINSI